MKKVYKILLLIFFIVIITLSIVLPLTIVKKKCNKDSDCKSNQTCIGGVCVDNVVPEEKCSKDSDCKPNQTCIEGVCIDTIVPTPEEDCTPPCQTNEKCIDKICIQKNWKCNNDYTCSITTDGIGEYVSNDECKTYCSETIPLRLHLYHGAFPKLGEAPINNAKYGIKDHWKKIADFANKNNFFCVYMNGDPSNINLIPSVVAEMASYLKPTIILGVIITANPLTPPPILFIDKYGVGVYGGNDLPNLNPQQVGNKCSNEEEEILPSTTPKTYKYKYPNGIGGYNTGVADEKLPTDKGCPNIIEMMINFYGEVNKEIKILREKKRLEIPYFTRFIQDTENNGSATARYGNWLQACITYILPTLPESFYDYDSGKSYGGKERIKIFRFGKAGSGSTNAEDIFKEMTCAGSSDTSDNTCDLLKVENMIAYPEVYWYNDGLAKASCRGCSHDMPDLYRNAKTKDVCTLDTPDGDKPDIPGACTGKCANFLGDDFDFQHDYDHDHSGVSYFEQAKQAGCEPCGHCLSCIPCGYDEQGNINKRIPYIKYLKDPVGLAEYMITDAMVTGVDNLWKRPNTIPMFSNELAHNFTAEESKTVAFNANDLNSSSQYGEPCLARKKYKDADGKETVGGDMCGTFDGFGLWTWEDFYTFLQVFSKKTEIKDLGVYDAQFISDEWQTSTFKVPPYYTNKITN
jgi:hypothetical protein